MNELEIVLIADDELNIREGLKHIIDWETLGFKICEEAGNGQEALDIILEKQPDLVLLDIRMPKINGTDVIRMAREKGYKGHFIFLSGYSDFTYAQTAIKFNADCYLTKPLDEDELTDALKEIYSKIKEEHSQNESLDSLKDKAKNVVLQELITGVYQSDIDLEQFDLMSDIYQTIILDNFKKSFDPITYDLTRLLRSSNSDEDTLEYFETDSRKVILLKCLSDINRFKNLIEKYENNQLEPNSPLDSLFITYGHIVFSPDEIYLSYEEALHLMDRRFFCTQGQHTLGYDELPNFNQKEKSITDDQLEDISNKIIGFMMSSNRTQLASELYNLQHFLYNVNNDIVQIKIFLTDMYLRIKEKICRSYPEANDVFPSNAQTIKTIHEFDYLYEIIQFISEQFEKIVSTNSPSREGIIDDILDYIQHNYKDNIKLESIAPLFGYNSAYLGKIFSKVTGENFNTYIDHCRIEQSKKLLLETEMKVYEISDAVGYSNVDYFHKKFKKYVGISPAEFKKGASR